MICNTRIYIKNQIYFLRSPDSWLRWYVSLVSAGLTSPRLLWWPPAESNYDIYDHFAGGYVSHAHCIELLNSVGYRIAHCEKVDHLFLHD